MRACSLVSLLDSVLRLGKDERIVQSSPLLFVCVDDDGKLHFPSVVLITVETELYRLR